MKENGDGRRYGHTVGSSPSAWGRVLVRASTKIVHQLSSVVSVVPGILEPEREIVVVEPLRNKLWVAAYIHISSYTLNSTVWLSYPMAAAG